MMTNGSRRVAAYTPVPSSTNRANRVPGLCLVRSSRYLLPKLSSAAALENPTHNAKRLSLEFSEFREFGESRESGEFGESGECGELGESREFRELPAISGPLRGSVVSSRRIESPERRSFEPITSDRYSSLITLHSSLFTLHSSLFTHHSSLFTSQRNIPMLFRRILVPLRVQHLERANQLRSCVPRLNHFIYESPLCRYIRRRELVPKLLSPIAQLLVGVRRARDLLPVQNVDRPLSPHHGNLCRRICKVDIGSNVFGRHHAISAAICFPGYDRHLRHRRLSKREQQLRAVTNDAAVLLPDPWQEPGNILESDQRDI